MNTILKTLVFLVVILTHVNQSFAQKYYTKSGKITFDATANASPEDIKGVNKSVTCVTDTKSGLIQFSALMKGFEFERALMEEHFNENYVESSKYPKAEFKGNITNNSDIDYAKDGVYNAKVKGKLTIHGETKDVEADGKLTIKNGKILATAQFVVTLADYKVSVPQVVADKIAKTAKISIDCTLELLKG